MRNYSENEWRGFFAGAGLDVEEVRIFDFPIEFGPWLERTGCTGPDADRVRALLESRVSGAEVVFERIALLARPADGVETGQAAGS